MIIVVLGFPGAGKTTLINKYLYYRLLKEGRSFFVQRGCPDGEGVWTSETANGKELARQRKRKFDEKFIEWVLTSIDNLSKVFEIVIVDCGGKQSEENKRIISKADKAFIVARTKEDAESWRNFIMSVKKLDMIIVFSRAENNTVVFEPSPDSIPI